MTDQEIQNELRQAALAMGYRRMKNGHWGKPFGHTILTIHTGQLYMAQYFWGANDELLCWCTVDLKKDTQSYGDFLYQIKDFECWSTKDGLENLSRGRSLDETNFAFVSQDEILRDVL